jgi:hypothetical protein
MVIPQNVKKSQNYCTLLPSLLGNGEKEIEIVYGEEKNILYWADKNSKGRTKNLFYRHDKPNEPTKKGPLSFVLFESPFTSVSTVSTGATPF